MKKFTLVIVLLAILSSLIVTAQEPVLQVIFINNKDTLNIKESEIKLFIPSEGISNYKRSTDILTEAELQSIKVMITNPKGWVYSISSIRDPNTGIWVTKVPNPSVDYWSADGSGKTIDFSGKLIDKFTWILSKTGHDVFLIHQNPNNPGQTSYQQIGLMGVSPTILKLEYFGYLGIVNDTYIIKK